MSSPAGRGTPAPPTAPDRAVLVQRGLWLNYATIGYNIVEAVVSIMAGLVAGSVALLGFGVDSAIEVTASGAAQWRLRADVDPTRRAHAEDITRRVIGASLLALAVYVAYESATALWHQARPERSVIGIVVLASSAVVMPLLARAKRRVATGLGSRALAADATQTSICAYLSGVALTGVVLNVIFGWWWADPVSGLVMVPIIAKEGVEGLRGEACTDCSRDAAGDCDSAAATSPLP